MAAITTDIPGVFASAGTAWLLQEAARLEAAQAGHFTTSLSDSEKRYLDVAAELYARGALPELEGPCHPSEVAA